MNIIVCIKQVPDTQKVKVDEKTGVLLRQGVDSKMNPYDLYAIETALKLKKKDDKVIAITMGPPSAKAILYEALALGVDDVYLLSDRKFAGADVLSTSYTIKNGILKIEGGYNLIICGKQTTDGDTAQVGPELAEHLDIPHVSFVSSINKISDDFIDLNQDMNEYILNTEVELPCLITVEKGIYEPNLPSFRNKQASMNHVIHEISLDDLIDSDINNYGLSGSPTQVEKIFEPTNDTKKVIYHQEDDTANKLFEVLVDLKYVEAKSGNNN